MLELCSLGYGGVTPQVTRPPRELCYHVKFGSYVTKGVRINIMELPKLWRAGSPPPCDRGVADPRNTPFPHVCFPVEFGRSMSNDTKVIKIRLKVYLPYIYNIYH